MPSAEQTLRSVSGDTVRSEQFYKERKDGKDQSYCHY